MVSAQVDAGQPARKARAGPRSSASIDNCSASGQYHYQKPRLTHLCSGGTVARIEADLHKTWLKASAEGDVAVARPAIGMMTYSFGGSVREGLIDVPGIVRLCARLGVEAIDLAESHWQDPERDIPATIAALEETGLTIASSHTGADLVTRGASAKAERERQLRGIFGRLARVNCKYVMLGSTTGDLAPGDWRREYGIGLGECAPIAEDYGLTVTFENRGGAAGLLVGTADHCEEILGHAADPRVRFTFDVANFRYVGADHIEAFERLVKVTSHVHLKDVVPRGGSFAMVPLGEGEVDNVPVIKQLAARGFDGCLAIECGGQGTDEEDARRSVFFVKDVLER